jgi:hypothetical protein
VANTIEGAEEEGGRGGREGEGGGKERGRPVYSFCMCPGGQVTCMLVLRMCC